MSIFGTVTVKDGKYKLKGDFHTITPNQPIRNADEDWRLMGVTNPSRGHPYPHVRRRGGLFRGPGHGPRYSEPSARTRTASFRARSIYPSEPTAPTA